MEVVAAVAESPVAMAVAEDEPPVEIATAVAQSPVALAVAAAMPFATSLMTGWSDAVGLCLSAA
jgi:hypothetical protein